MTREGEGIAATVLADPGVELEKARKALEFIVGRGDRPVQSQLGLTPRAETVLGFAAMEADSAGRQEMNTEDLLLGLLREGEGIGAGMLVSLGVTPENARRAIRYYLDTR